MIVQWNEARLKGIPTGPGKTLVLLGGYNEVAPKDWKVARELVLDEIAAGRLVEVEPKLEEVPEIGPDKKPTGGKKVVIKGATAFKDLDPEKAISIVKGTFCLTTLETWRKTSVRDEVRMVIQEQMARINRAGAKE